MSDQNPPWLAQVRSTCQTLRGVPSMRLQCTDRVSAAHPANSPASNASRVTHTATVVRRCRRRLAVTRSAGSGRATSGVVTVAVSVGIRAHDLGAQLLPDALVGLGELRLEADLEHVARAGQCDRVVADGP